MNENERLRLMIACMFLITGLSDMRQRRPDFDTLEVEDKARVMLSCALANLGIDIALPPTGADWLSFGMQVIDKCIGKTRERIYSERIAGFRLKDPL